MDSNRLPARRYHLWLLWLCWTVATAVGELVGFTIPAIAGAAAAWLQAGQLAMASALVLAELGEGAMLGLAQWLVLRHPLPSLTRRSWVAATALAAGFAWIIGMLPSTIGELASVSPICWWSARLSSALYSSARSAVDSGSCCGAMSHVLRYGCWRTGLPGCWAWQCRLSVCRCSQTELGRW